jgi:glycosyltransferase involved in cell wall biosynthesis
MRILMLAQAYAPIMGGEERVVELLGQELHERGHHVAVAALRQPVAQEHPGGGVRVHELRTATHRLRGAQRDPGRRYAPPAPDPETVRDLREVLRLERPDVVHAHNLLVHSFLPLKRSSGAALVLSLHDYSVVCATKRLFRLGAVCSGPGLVKCTACASRHYGPLRGPAMAAGTLATLPWVRRSVDLFLPISRAVWELCDLGPDVAHLVMPNFLREPPARVSDDPRLDELPDEYVLFFGDVQVDKGAAHLVDAYAELEQPPPLVLLGRQHLPALRGRPHVRLLGPWPPALVAEAVRRCLFTVAPSIWAEPLGMVAYETAVAGRAMIASRIGGLQDVVLDGETGLLVPPGDRPALRDAIARLLGDAALRERLGAAAGARARAQLMAESVVPRFEEAYRLALDLAAPVRAAR